MVPTMNSYTMAQKIKDATLIVYPIPATDSFSSIRKPFVVLDFLK